MSERPSHDASRASSPPPSIVGSAPATKSTAQKKKERKEKNKKPNELSETTSIASTPVIEEAAPVIGRQRKQKKQRENTTVDEPVKKPAEQNVEEKAPAPAPAASEPAPRTNKNSPPQEDNPEFKQGLSATPPLLMPEEPLPPAKSEQKSTLRDLCNELAKINDPAHLHEDFQRLLSQHVSSTPQLLSSLIANGDIPKDHPWLAPQALTSAAYRLPTDSRKGQAYLDANGYTSTTAFGLIYLPLREKHALKDGSAVSVADAGDRKDDLLKRCLVTPNGWVLRHLSRDESDRVLELEERRGMFLEEFGMLGDMPALGPLESDDYANLGGGMEELSKRGNRHGVIWIQGDENSAEGVYDNDDEEGDEGDDEFFDDDDGIHGEIPLSDSEELDEDEEDYEDEDEEEIDDENVIYTEDGVTWEDHRRQHRPIIAAGAGVRPGLQSRVSHGGRVNSLPGLGPHSRTNALRLPIRGPQQSTNLQQSPTTRQPAPNPEQQQHISPEIMQSLRQLDAESLSKRLAESQKVLEQARRDMEKIEKVVGKKVREGGKFREGLVKA
jgi:hypothetical protein